MKNLENIIWLLFWRFYKPLGFPIQAAWIWIMVFGFALAWSDINADYFRQQNMSYIPGKLYFNVCLVGMFLGFCGWISSFFRSK